MKILVVVPAFNEAKSLPGVIFDLKKHHYKNILVVNDGSSDKTELISQKGKVVVLNHAINRGLGAGLGSGFKYAKINDFDVIVTFDGDGQHQAKDLKNYCSRS